MPFSGTRRTRRSCICIVRWSSSRRSRRLPREPMGALDHASRGFALYDAETHASLAAAYGNHDPGMCSRGFGAWTLLLLGFPERALAALRQATGLSERLGHPFNVAWGHYYAAF